MVLIAKPTVCLTCRVCRSPTHSSQPRPEEEKPEQSMGRPHPCCSSQLLYTTWCKRSKKIPCNWKKNQGSCQQELTWYSWLSHLTVLPVFRPFLSQQDSQGNIISPSNLSCWIQKPSSEHSLSSTKGFIWLSYLPFSAASWESGVLNLKLLFPFKLR